MKFVALLRTLEPRLRIMLIATTLFAILQGGQFMLIAQRNLGGAAGSSGFLYVLTSLFFIPSGIILTGAVLWLVRHNSATQRPLLLLGLINILLAFHLAWYAIDSCSWAMMLGLQLGGC